MDIAALHRHGGHAPWDSALEDVVLWWTMELVDPAQNVPLGFEGQGPNQMEEAGTLVSQVALTAILDQRTTPGQPFPLFDGSHIFVHAPQYHWHVEAAEGMATID